MFGLSLSPVRSWSMRHAAAWAQRAVLLAIVLCSACSSASESVTSLYRPELARNLSQEERWQLDLELMNEISMREHGNRRFGGPDPWDARARWVEEVATWYPVADLIQQLLDFRKGGRVRHNEAAFNKLVELGQSGDVSARCFAGLLYALHRAEVTGNWRYTYEMVKLAALAEEAASGHPVCLGSVADIHSTGVLGYATDKSLAKQSRIRAAVAGSYGDQILLARSHVSGVLKFDPMHLGLEICWQRVAYTHSEDVGYVGRCSLIRRGRGIDVNFEVVDAPPAFIAAGIDWCTPEKKVSAQTCADLEINNQ